MPYRISRSDINRIADVLPDAYVIENGDETVELVLQGAVDRTTANPIAHAINEENIEEYQKAKRLQLIEEVREIQSFKASVEKRVLCAIVNDAIRVIHG
jgi:hypothetical protein